MSQRMKHDPLFDQLSIEVTPRGVSGVRFGGQRRVSASGPTDTQSPLAEAALEEIDEYLEGQRTRFELPLDLQSASPFRGSVLKKLLTIPFGETVSYGELADRVGCNSARAVGQAVGWNPLPILVPCHRVVTHGGRLGGYSGGLDRKLALLRLEGIEAESTHLLGQTRLRRREDHPHRLTPAMTRSRR